MTQAAILAASGSPGTTTGFKNKLINGAMVIDQRNAGASISTASASSGYGVDRWQWAVSQNSKMTLQQNAGSVTPPVGFTNYFGITSSSAYSLAAGDYFVIAQFIEGFNTADLAWGTANAKTITLSFWVQSSLTGTFGGCLQNNATNRSYPFTYTISSANTWQQISITIPGDTTGTWLTNNSAGIKLWFGLGVGSTYSGAAGSWSGGNYLSATGATSVVGTSGATFYITGVQLEVGTTATNFDFRSYTTELQLCQRYCYSVNSSVNANAQFFMGFIYDATNFYGVLPIPVQMRAGPTLSYPSGSAFRVNSASLGYNSSSINLNQTSQNAAWINCPIAGGVAGQGADLAASASTTTAIILSAEL